MHARLRRAPTRSGSGYQTAGSRARRATLANLPASHPGGLVRYQEARGTGLGLAICRQLVKLMAGMERLLEQAGHSGGAGAAAVTVASPARGQGTAIRPLICCPVAQRRSFRSLASATRRIRQVFSHCAGAVCHDESLSSRALGRTGLDPRPCLPERWLAAPAATLRYRRSLRAGAAVRGRGRDHQPALHRLCISARPTPWSPPCTIPMPSC